MTESDAVSGTEQGTQGTFTQSINIMPVGLNTRIKSVSFIYIERLRLFFTALYNILIL